MGGFAGLATGLVIATEYQGEATPHGHGFASLVNMYQHNSLQEIGTIIEQNARGIDRQVMLDRLFKFVEHVQREDHVDDAQHQTMLDPGRMCI